MVYVLPLSVPPNKLYRFSVKDSGIDKTLFSIQRTEKSGIMIFLKQSQLVHDLKPSRKVRKEDFAHVFDEKGRIQKHAKISVHHTRGSNIYNVLTYRKITHDDFKQDFSGITSAIKRKDGYAHLVNHICTDISLDFYDEQKNKRYYDISLGDFNSKEFTLCYSIFVSSSELKVPITGKFDFYTSYVIDLEEYRITILASKISLPSYSKSTTSYFLSNSFYQQELGEGALSRELDEIIKMIEVKGSIDDLKSRFVNRFKPEFAYEEYRSSLYDKIKFQIELIKQDIGFDIPSDIVQAYPLQGVSKAFWDL